MRTKTGLIIGDSIGWTLTGTPTGVGTSTATPYSSQLWPHVMVQQLNQTYPSTRVRMVNRSFGGQSTTGALMRLAGCIQFPFDFLIIQLGTNDCASNAIAPATTQANLQAMVQRTRILRGSSLPVVLCAPPNTSDATRTPYVAATQAAVAASVAALGSGVALARLQDAWLTANNAANLNADGIHPNTAGHAAMAPIVQAALVTVAGSLLT